MHHYNILFMALYWSNASLALSAGCNSKVLQQGREEPQYVGFHGFINGEPPNSWDKYRGPPKPNWTATAYDKQIGPSLYTSTGKFKLPHKTPVKVINQSLEHVSHGYYKGLLTVELTDSTKKQYLIEPHNFTPAPFWACSAKTIKDNGNVIAKYIGKNKPVDREGRWVDLPLSAILYCGKGIYISRGISDYGEDGQLACRAYTKKGESEIVYEFNDIHIIY